MCIFCSIVEDKIPSQKLYQDDYLIVIKDINPKADQHLLVIPKIHIQDLRDIDTPEKKEIVEYMITNIPIITKNLNVEDFRLISNCGKNAGQEVDHLHFHILSGHIHF